MDRKVRESSDGLGFLFWIKYCTEYPDFRISQALQLYTRRELTSEELRAYDAPFPDESYKQGARAFPKLVPILPDDPAIADNRRAWKVLERFTGPVLTAFSDDDPYSAGADRRFRQTIPGARDQNHVTLHGPSHFLQEDAGEMLAGLIVGFCRANQLSNGEY
jgi:haloalkane dehalogenase